MDLLEHVRQNYSDKFYNILDKMLSVEFESRLDIENTISLIQEIE
jgi:hypothetical protein